MKRVGFLLLILLFILSGCSTAEPEKDAGKAAAKSKLVEQGSDSTGETKRETAKEGEEAKASTTPGAGEAENNNDEPPVTGGYALIDWVDFIKFNGIDYHAEGTNTLSIGKKLDTVKFNVSENVHNPEYKTKNGDAAFLAQGTPVYEVQGYNPNFRLAAGNKLYEAFHNPKAKVGRDLLDIKDKVEYIGINSETDGKTELGQIKNREEVKELIEMVLKAPVNEKFESDEGLRYFICFYLKDGTSTTRVLFVNSNKLGNELMLPRAFGNKIKEAVK